MPPKAAAAAAAGATGISLTPREQELMSFAFQCLEAEPKIDMKKFSDMAGFTNQGSASNAWRSIKTKIGLAVPTKKGPTTPATPATGSGRKRTKKESGEDEDTPSKKPRARKTKAKREETDDEDAPGSPDDMADASSGAHVKAEDDEAI
ncbi:hypothetical protein C1H76_0617 [Elsinoe australis]|uniref:Uncharacterized protein n=1 Tax=Elsinoe australis TaxID=40998 RepID=A0A4U7BBB3_9PEZI|nr:hypothetical protein C1H76_0617 [Elsinoe australis]